MGLRNLFDFIILHIPIGLVGVFILFKKKKLYSVEAFIKLGKMKQIKQNKTLKDICY